MEIIVSAPGPVSSSSRSLARFVRLFFHREGNAKGKEEGGSGGRGKGKAEPDTRSRNLQMKRREEGGVLAFEQSRRNPLDP